MELKYEILKFLLDKKDNTLINHLLIKSELNNKQINAFLTDLAITEKIINIDGIDYMVIGSKKGTIDGGGERGLSEINVKATITEKGKSEYSNFLLHQKTIKSLEKNEELHELQKENLSVNTEDVKKNPFRFRLNLFVSVSAVVVSAIISIYYSNKSESEIMLLKKSQLRQDSILKEYVHKVGELSRYYGEAENDMKSFKKQVSDSLHKKKP